MAAAHDVESPRRRIGAREKCGSARGFAPLTHDDRKFLEALHYFTLHSITWRALPLEFGNWNSVWKRFWRLSRRGVFEAFFQLLAETSETAHIVQMFDSTVVRAHVSAAGAKGGSKIRRSGGPGADFRAKFISGRTSPDSRSLSI
jgi:transposase